MFIALICFVKTIIDYSNKSVLRKKSHDQVTCQDKNPKKKKKNRLKFKKKKFFKYAEKGMYYLPPEVIFGTLDF